MPSGWVLTETKTSKAIGEDGVEEFYYTFTNTKATAVALSGQKRWQKPNSVLDKDLPDVTIRLTVKNKAGEAVESLGQTKVVNADNEWKYTFNGVPTTDENGDPYIYNITEEVPEVPGVTITQVSTSPSSGGGTDFTNRYQGNVTLNIEKVWDDDGYEVLRPDTLTLRVVGTIYTGEVYTDTVELSAADNWTTAVTLPHWYYAEDTEGLIEGYEINYTVQEDTVPGYQKAVCIRTPETGYTNEGTASVTLTNTLCTTMKVTVRKLWLGSGSSISTLPNVKVHLTGQCGTLSREEEVTLSYRTDWTETLNLPLYSQENGKKWTWTVTEDALSGWSLSDVEVSEETDGDGSILRTYILKNTPDDQETVTLTASKLWKRPSTVDEYSLPDVTVILHVKKNGTEVESLRETRVLNADNGWYDSFTVLSRDPEDDTLYTYEFTEEVEGLGSSVTQLEARLTRGGGIEFTNVWNGELPLTLTKVWDDDNDSKGHRPKAVTIQIFGHDIDNNVIVEKDVELTGNGDTWTTLVEGLPKWYYDEDGNAHEIEYRAGEETVPYYASTITEVKNGDVLTGFTITNKLLDYMHVVVKKRWIGEEYSGLVTVTIKNAYYKARIETITGTIYYLLPLYSFYLGKGEDWQYTLEQVYQKSGE